ncbi:YihY/virulence factor BrkB family protein [Kitasatospora sp. A2-31]|uniref:YihY/virulence factor BrkB family protein n=1 Tax=Kitasatospora sp. A2-31 TaxID=2916414 RepID=UPI001EEDC7D3|nr:YihY/virulence factor BrkB family protein [Kitasatospora sp. A2-31]MCG6499262.1 YihY/virulence factor BrkB family protein [Kitasatospora sp. A2-31]
MDFVNQALLLAATLLMFAVPFMLVASALGGRSAVPTLTLRLGLSHEAAADLGHLFASSAATSAAISGLSWVFFVLAGVVVAGSLQQLYQQVFQLPSRGRRDRLRALIWLVLCVALLGGGSTLGYEIHKSVPILWWFLNVLVFVGFFWFSMWFLLAGRIGWRTLLPCAVATGTFWIGMVAFFNVALSRMVVNSNREYGPIGAVFSLMSFFIAIGVVIILGAATGMTWQDRGMSVRAAANRLRRTA